MVNLVDKDRNYLTIATWNAHSLSRGKIELGFFLEARDISVMMASETLFKKGQSFHVKRFQIFRKDRESTGGGVAVLVRNVLQARQVDLDSPLEAVGIEVEVKGNRHRFISLYIPPSRVFEEADVI